MEKDKPIFVFSNLEDSYSILGKDFNGIDNLKDLMEYLLHIRKNNSNLKSLVKKYKKRIEKIENAPCPTLHTSTEEWLFGSWKKSEISIYKKVIKDLEKMVGNE